MAPNNEGREWEKLAPAINDHQPDTPSSVGTDAERTLGGSRTTDKLLRARRAETVSDSSQMSEDQASAASSADATETGEGTHVSGQASAADEERSVPGDTADSAASSAAVLENNDHEPGVAAVAASSKVTADDAPISIADRQAEAAERANAREIAVNDRPRFLRLRQLIIALAVPLVTLALSVRLIATTGFLWLAYHRPGFPADSFGFDTAERMRLGSYGLEYILNFAPRTYLSELTNSEGQKWFLAKEVEHMTDVKHVMIVAMILATVWAVLAMLSSRSLKERAPGAIRKSIFAGSWLTLALMVALGVLGALGWESFFTRFHELFFPQGNWMFRTSDTLIRLYPPQFWVDAGIAVAALAVLLTILTMVLSWPTKFRRERARKNAADRLALKQKLSQD